jgi:hypothetical protein
MATAKNDVTGDSLRSKPSSESYANNYDNIFRKKPQDNLLDSPEVTPDKPMEPSQK